MLVDNVFYAQFKVFGVGYVLIESFYVIGVVVQQGIEITNFGKGDSTQFSVANGPGVVAFALCAESAGGYLPAVFVPHFYHQFVVPFCESHTHQL